MRTLWFGGSFNPIHSGHLICARAVAEAGGFDQVTLVPAAEPPHKQLDTTLAAPHQRLAMCKLATQGDPYFSVDDLELKRQGPSYTIDSVRQIKSSGHAAVCWLIGGDSVASLPSWHESDRLLAETLFVVMARAGWKLDWEKLPAGVRKLQTQLIKAPDIEISSTQIRKRISMGRSIQYLTPQPVIQYIREHKLYGAR